MRKILTAGVVALTLGGAILGAAVPANAEPYGHWHGGGWRGGWRGDDAGVAIAAGILGLAVGSALASDHPHYYYGAPPYYGPGYYGGPVYYRGRGPYPGYAACIGRREVWDPYFGGYVVRSFRYAC